jgi:exopolysaccharide biosynthesis polyprenyl glycosylphosphotransferase
MFNHDRLLYRKLILCFGDLAVLSGSLFIALSLRKLQLITLAEFRPHLPIFLPIFFLSIIIFFLFDLYSIKVLKNISHTTYLLFLAVSLNTLLSISFLYIFIQFFALTPKTVLLLFAFFDFFLTLVWRFLFFDLFFSRYHHPKKVLLIGSSEANENIQKIAASAHGADYVIVGFVSVEKERSASPYANLPYLGQCQDIQKIIRGNRVQELVIAFDYRNFPELVREFSDSLALGVKIFEWPIFYEEVFQKVPTNHIDHFWFIGNLNESDKRFYERVKRFFDIMIALVGTLILGLFTPFIALGIKMTSPGPVFYKQKRTGLNGKDFWLVKFRTMKIDAERNGAQWSGKNDPRVTRFGRFLRKTRLDEMPQFLNILKGDMSLVGPRPERPEFMAILNQKIPFYYKRHIVRPGATGFAQIMFPYAASIEDSIEKVGYDLYYIKNRSLFLYFKIILRTVRVMMMFKGR